MRKSLLLSIVACFAFAFVAKSQTLVLQVDMTYVATGQVSGTTFDPATDTIDVAGSFSGWGETVMDLTRVSDTAYYYQIALDLDSANHVIEYKFRINHSWDGDRHDQLPGNRKLTVREGTEYADTVKHIWSDIAPDHERVTFKVNMSKQIADGNYDPEVDFLDLAGSFNNWGGYNELFAGADDIYSGYVLAPIGDIEWKTRMNASWDNDQHEQLAANRLFTVTEGGENIVEYWYGDDTATTSVTNEYLADVKAYPNPFNNTLTIDNLENANNIIVSNILGQEFATFNSFTSNSIEINTSEFDNGIYFVTIISNNNTKRTIKIVKQ